MKIVPVLDLLDGQVVHAVRGERSRYQPAHSVLCDSADPNEMVQAFLDLHPFETIYIADLNAINGSGNHESTIPALVEQHTPVEFWVDRGIRDRQEIERLRHPGQRHVIGSETGISMETFSTVREQYPEIILSLDFLHGRLKGDKNLMHRPDAWPGTVIIMELDRVGSGGGPDRDRLASIKKAAAGRSLFAAGGIRNGKDLDVINRSGIDGALIASALHRGTVTREDLHQFRVKKMPRRAGHHPSNG